MQQFVERVHAVGYNAVSLDDVAYLADHEWYEPEIREQIQVYRQEYQKLFQIIQEKNLAIYLTMDVCSLTPALKKRLNDSFADTLHFLRQLLDQFMSDFPQISGVIVRIGESDGLDVKNQFKSELILKTPAMVNEFLQELFPIFEKHNKRLIKKLAKQLDLPHEDIVYMKDTFMLLALARQYFFYPYDEKIKKRLKREKRKYKARYPKRTRPRYRVKMDFEPFHINSKILHWSFNILLRRQRGYRLLDQLFVIHMLSIIYRWLSRSRSEWIPKFARKSAMGIDTIFR